MVIVIFFIFCNRRERSQFGMESFHAFAAEHFAHQFNGQFFVSCRGHQYQVVRNHHGFRFLSIHLQTKDVTPVYRIDCGSAAGCRRNKRYFGSLKHIADIGTSHTGAVFGHNFMRIYKIPKELGCFYPCFISKFGLCTIVREKLSTGRQ